MENSNTSYALSFRCRSCSSPAWPDSNVSSIPSGWTVPSTSGAILGFGENVPRSCSMLAPRPLGLVPLEHIPGRAARLGSDAPHGLDRQHRVDVPVQRDE